MKMPLNCRSYQEYGRSSPNCKLGAIGNSVASRRSSVAPSDLVFCVFLRRSNYRLFGTFAINLPYFSYVFRLFLAHAMMMSDHESANGGVSSSAVNAATPSANPSGSMISTAATIAQEPAAKHKAPLYNPYVSGGGWDPVGSADWDARKPSDFCLGRIARDLHSLYTDPIAVSETKWSAEGRWLMFLLDRSS